MTAILDHIHSLEALAARTGVRLMRTPLPDFIHGRLCEGEIRLRAGLTPEQELPVLVHELAHWLAHARAHAAPPATLCEYEAEAVEELVLARLGLRARAVRHDDPDYDAPTDGLLLASVARVIWAGDRICDALGLAPQRASEGP